MHYQIDGVAMGSPLGQALANILVGYYEMNYFGETTNQFCIFDTLITLETSSTKNTTATILVLNSSQFYMTFTFEKEAHGKLPVLDVLVGKI